MVNRSLFTYQSSPTSTDTTNKAGGVAHSFSNEHALCQLACTGTFNSTFYATAQNNFDDIKHIAESVYANNPDLILKSAVYGRANGKMKDMPAYLLAFAAAKGVDWEKFDSAWDKVINNTKMLLNFCQIIRSGVLGRKSFGTHIKRLIQKWIISHSDDSLFSSSFGHSQPSLKDVIKMVHPRPNTPSQRALLGYITDNNKYDCNDLPEIVQTFEKLKKNETDEVPNIPFMALNNITLSTKQWTDIAMKMPWNTLRMNLNNLYKHGVFDNPKTLNDICNIIRNPELIKKNNYVFPYSIFTTYKNLNVDNKLKYALQDALELATKNVPTLNCGKIAICPDLSGSMSGPVTGYSSASTSVTCYDIVGLFTTTLLRKNPDALVLAWADRMKKVNINAYDSIVTNIDLIKSVNVGGGTNSSLPISYLNLYKKKCDVIIYISDNQSWISSNNYYHHTTQLQDEWNIYKKNNRNAKLVCIDIQPYTDTQVPDSKDVLNIGGFNDSVFDVISDFVNNAETNFVKTIEEVIL